jgi:hypothetical protein
MSFQTLFSDIRVFLYGGLQTFPLTIAGTFLILGLMTANYAMLFFLVGYLLLVPIASTIINLIIPKILPALWFTVPKSDICNIRLPFPPETTSLPTTIVSSNWMAMTVFFLGYMLSNAISLYNLPSSVEDDKGKVVTRTTQSMLSVISILMFSLFIIFMRTKLVKCETTPSIIITTILFGTLGWSWYRALAATGEDRLSDLFGVANRLLSPEATQNAPIACFPQA